jgi:hypothetical protein
MKWADLFFYKDGTLYRNKHINARYPFGEKVGHTNTEGYILVWVGKKRFRAHRIIYEMHFGDIPDGFEVDHIDRNRSHNRIENLRLVNRSFNNLNISTRKDNKTGFTGVSFNKRRNKYIAQIRYNNMITTIGQYDSPEEASCAYNNYKEKLYDLFYRW